MTSVVFFNAKAADQASCEAIGQLYNTSTGKCVSTDNNSYTSCSDLGKQYNVVTNECVEACGGPLVLNTDTNTCVSVESCQTPYSYDEINKVCVKNYNCESGKIRDVFNGLCILREQCSFENERFIDTSPNPNLCVPVSTCDTPTILNVSTNNCMIKVDCDPDTQVWRSSDNTCITVATVCRVNEFFDVNHDPGVSGCIPMNCPSNQTFSTIQKSCVDKVASCDTDNGYTLNQTTNICVFNPILADPSQAISVDPGSIYRLTVGFNPLSTNHERLYGIDGKISDWTVTYQLAGRTFSGQKCDQSTNEIIEDGYIINTADYYINKNNSCDVPDGFDYSREDYRSVPSSDSLNYNLIWLDLGLSPDPLGTTETIKCSFGGNCVEDLSTTTPKTQANIDLSKNEYPLSLTTLSPTAGTRPILSGNNTAFLYGYENLNYSNTTGIPGVGGRADLPAITPAQSVKYCYRKRDATTEPELSKSFYAEHPKLDFLKINWKPFIENPTSSDGDPGTLKNGKTTVIKGLDSSVRFWMGNDNVLNKK